LLDLGDGGLGVLLPPVHDLPARAFGQVAPHVDDDQGEHRADQAGEPSTQLGGDVVQEVQRDQGAQEDPAQ
jgi:hypothetical protein